MEQEGGKAGRFRDGSEIVIGACIEVHRCLGPGLLESAYELCLAHELYLRGLRVEGQRPVPLRYKGVRPARAPFFRGDDACRMLHA